MEYFKQEKDSKDFIDFELLAYYIGILKNMLHING